MGGLTNAQSQAHCLVAQAMAQPKPVNKLALPQQIDRMKNKTRNANTWYKSWLGFCGFDTSNLVPTSVSVGHSDSRLTATTSYHHR